jgi:hypothetical protein
MTDVSHLRSTTARHATALEVTVIRTDARNMEVDPKLPRITGRLKDERGCNFYMRAVSATAGKLLLPSP